MYESYTRVYERSGKKNSVQHGIWWALHVEHIIIYYLFEKESVDTVTCVCGKDGEGIERRKDRRLLVVLVRQLVPNIEWPPKPLSYRTSTSRFNSFAYRSRSGSLFAACSDFSGLATGTATGFTPSGSWLSVCPVNGSRTGSESGAKSVRASSRVVRIMYR